MREEYVLRAAHGELFRERRRGFVRQVPEVGQNTQFDVIWIRAAEKHILVMVRLEYDIFRAGESRFDVRRYVPEVGGEGESIVPCHDRESDTANAVVRRREAAYLKRTDSLGINRRMQHGALRDRRVFRLIQHCMSGLFGEMHRNAVLF